MKEKTCCFTGHRNIPVLKRHHIQKRLTEEVEKMIQNGVVYFGAGGALGFDTMAALTVLSLKPKYPQIKLILVLPCPEQSERWSDKDKATYEYIKAKADKVVYTSDHYDRGCMFKRNRHLVDNSNYCICYLTEETGGTAYTVKYAKEKNITVINVAR